MPEIDLFALYRRLLLIVGGTYTVVRLVQSLWRWHVGSLAAPRPEALVRRWVEVSILRLRFRRFTWEVLQVGLQAAILLYIIGMQIAPSAEVSSP